MTLLVPAYIGIGSNQGHPYRQVEAAFNALAALPQTRLIARSRIYGSRPYGPVVQEDFLNAAAGLLTALPPAQLLLALQGIEAQQGRVRGVRWGPRTLDLDLLVYGDLRQQSPELQLPHPGIVERNFVLYPLMDIAPALQIPGLGKVSELAARVGDEGIRVLAPPDAAVGPTS